MIILLLILFIIFTIIFAVLTDTLYDFDIVFGFLSFISGIAAFICLVILITLCYRVVDSRIIDQKIELYSEQNKQIENDISDLVSKYMNYESTTFTNLSTDSSITLVSLYPELKADTLVEQQCNLYTENNKKITELKEDKLYVSIYKWWLYFGK